MLNLSNILNYFHLERHRFAETAKDLWGFFYVRIYLIIIIGIIFLNWLSVYIININVSQDLVVLHYNIDFGVNLIGSVRQIYLIPLLGLVVLLVNLFLLIIVYKYANQPISRSAETADKSDSVKLVSGKIFAHLLLASSLLANFFLLMGISSIYLINFFR